MPAVSKKQQRFFGMVRAAQKGEMENPSPEVAKVAASASVSDVKKFAKTKHKGLPEKKKVEEETKKCKIGYYYCYTDKKCKKIPMGYHVGARGLLAKDENSEESEETKKNGKSNGNGNGNGANGANGGNGNGGGSNGSVSEESNPRIPRKKGQPANSKKHSDLYTDENPKGTIHGLGFKDVATSKASVSKIKKSSRSHAHKIQAAVAMEQRAREMGKTAEAAVYRAFINTMKKKTKKMNEETKYERYDKEKKEFAKVDKRMKFGKFYSKAKEAKDRLRPGEVKRYDKKLGRYVSNKD
jgi:hypothetical protein